MAAKPIERFVKKQIMDQGGWERILTRIASGETIAGIARTLYRPDGPHIDRSTLAHMLHRDPERSAKTREARIEAASALVDEAILSTDDAPRDKDAIQKARVQADVRLKVAALLDREQYGSKDQAVTVNVNVASMHLDALRHREQVAVLAEVVPPALPVLDGAPAVAVETGQ